METEDKTQNQQFRQPDVSGSIGLSEKEKIEIKRMCLSEAITVCRNSSLESLNITVGESKSENVLEVAKKFENYLLNT